MSYILDALKKSDQQRQQGAAPSLMTVELPPDEASQSAFPWVLVFAATLFVAGILIGWLQPWKSEAPPAPPPAATGVATAVVTAPPPVVPAPLPVPVPVPAAAPPVAAVAPAPARRADPVPQASKASQSLSPVVSPPPAPTPVPVPPPKPAVATDPNVMAKADLPPAILQELPSMSVSLHAYSAKPASRLVSINDKYLQEGDVLAPGLTLEQITQKDMIFSYRGYRFRQGVQ